MGLSTVKAFKQFRPANAIELSEEQLQELQRTLGEMLNDISDLCEKYGIQYQLGGGTALGAVRHAGFIPWDDDIDLNMPREDHERFTELFLKEHGERYWVHTAQRTQGYGLTLSRVLKKGTSVRTREDFFNPDECGAFIDIFPIESTYDNALRRLLHGIGCMGLGFIQSCAKFWRDREFLMAMLDKKKQKKLCRVFRIKIAVGAVFSFLSLDAWTRLTDRWYSMCRKQDSLYVVVPSGKNHFFGELYRREKLCSTTLVPFEGRKRPIAAEYDEYLTHLYGDYKAVPPADKQEKHIFFKPFYL